ncbi:MAG: V-type ATP synthase subunit K [Clostridiales bacterium]|nr:V-type ATP synthase subunit K [Clostridiales bacterium]
MISLGVALAIIGAALAAILSGMGSAKGVGLVAEAASGVITEDPSKFGKVLILEILPGTQGLYGFLTAIMLISGIGVLGGNVLELSTWQGLAYLGACLPIAITGYFSAIAQGRAAASGVSIVAKKPDQNGKAIIMAVMVETYAVLTLLVSLLAVNSITSIVK